jgi:hypothetical protein
MFDEYPFELMTKIRRHSFGRVGYTVAYLTKELQKQLPLDKHPRLRIDGEVGGVRFSNALHPASGRWYVLLPKRLLKKCGLKLGDEVFVQFRIADQDAVEVPAELQKALDVHDQANEVWNRLTPGKKRGYAYRVASAKRPETRENRVLEVIELIRNGAKEKRRGRFTF